MEAIVCSRSSSRPNATTAIAEKSPSTTPDLTRRLAAVSVAKIVANWADIAMTWRPTRKATPSNIRRFFSERRYSIEGCCAFLTYCFHSINGGEGGIRTLGGSQYFNKLQSRRVQIASKCSQEHGIAIAMATRRFPLFRLPLCGAFNAAKTCEVS